MYSLTFVGFSATVLYPLATGTRDADTVFDDFGVIYTIHAGWRSWTRAQRSFSRFASSSMRARRV
jgi:hypothetical protein